MKYPLALLFLLTSFQQINAQHLPQNTSIDQWLGVYEGTLAIYAKDSIKMTIPMKMDHFETDTIGTYGWYLIYGTKDNQDTRKYYLKLKDAEKGYYQIDEKNGIVLDAMRIGNKLITDFEVEGSTITSIYTLEDPSTITFEIIAGNLDTKLVSGGIDSIPLVNSYRTMAYQKAVLKKVSSEDKSMK